MAVVVVQGGYRGNTDKHDVQQHSGGSGEEDHNAEDSGGGRHSPIIEGSQSGEVQVCVPDTVVPLPLSPYVPSSVLPASDGGESVPQGWGHRSSDITGRPG